MAQTRADLYETKVQAKEISDRESFTVGESSTVRENSSLSRNNRRDDTDNQSNPDDQFLNNIKNDVPTFDGRHDPLNFSKLDTLTR